MLPVWSEISAALLVFFFWNDFDEFRKRSCATGWLAVGTRKCVVGVTFTSMHANKDYNYPLRSNFNLRGHNAEVYLSQILEKYVEIQLNLDDFAGCFGEMERTVPEDGYLRC